MKKDLPIQPRLMRLLVVGLFVLTVFSAGAMAIEITVDVPSTPTEFNKVVTIPVTIHNSGDVIAFAASVPNNVNGATITINSAQPLSEGMYAINSNEGRQNQRVSWISSEGINQNMATMFFIDVVVSDEKLSSVPVVVTFQELGSDKNGALSAGSYSVKQGVLLTTAYDGTQPIVTPTVTQTEPTVAPTTVPTTTETVSPTSTVSPTPATSPTSTVSPASPTSTQTNPVPTTPVQTETVPFGTEPTTVPTSTSTPFDTMETAPTLPSSSGQKTPVQTSGLPLILVVLSVAGAAMICSRRL